jgi:hypothetical protein
LHHLPGYPAHAVALTSPTCPLRIGLCRWMCGCVSASVCARIRICVRACMYVCAYVCVGGGDVCVLKNKPVCFCMLSTPTTLACPLTKQRPWYTPMLYIQCKHQHNRNAIIISNTGTPEQPSTTRGCPDEEEGECKHASSPGGKSE